MCAKNARFAITQAPHWRNTKVSRSLSVLISIKRRRLARQFSTSCPTVRREDPTEELKHARDGLISALRAAKDSPARRDDFTISQASAGLSGTLDEYLVGVEAVTREDVIAAARKIQTDTVYFLKGAAE